MNLYLWVLIFFSYHSFTLILSQNFPSTVENRSTNFSIEDHDERNDGKTVEIVQEVCHSGEILHNAKCSESQLSSFPRTAVCIVIKIFALLAVLGIVYVGIKLQVLTRRSLKSHNSDNSYSARRSTGSETSDENSQLELDSVRMEYENMISIEPQVPSEKPVDPLQQSTSEIRLRNTKLSAHLAEVAFGTIPETPPPAVLLSKIGSVNIYDTDINSLDSEMWLTDAVVDGYLNILQYKNGKKRMHNFGAFFHFYLRQNTNEEIFLLNSFKEELKCDFLTFPVCEMDHWMVIMASKGTASLETYNSIGVSEHDTIIEKRILEFLNEYNVRNNHNFLWKLPKSRSKCSVQYNDHDCGVYVCKFVENVCDGKSCNFDSSELNGYRKFLKKALIEGTKKDGLH